LVGAPTCAVTLLLKMVVLMVTVTVSPLVA
jgi:hypothetical protein